MKKDRIAARIGLAIEAPTISFYLILRSLFRIFRKKGHFSKKNKRKVTDGFSDNRRKRGIFISLIRSS